ncbi:MAG: DUF3177 family protein [Cyanothece sp. SIO1E1]|nr:DUF3177 family protein [Cyanothece sp. SIO1E1]
MPYQSWLRPLIWTDYRLAIIFTVALPLILLVWAFVQKAEAIQRLLIIYWRVSSLLAITVYLMIGGLNISFITAFMARCLIPASLWFWLDLNEEIDDQAQSALKLIFSAWRWAVTVYSSLGALLQIPFLGCAFSKSAFATANCQTWIEPPLVYKDYFHAGFTNGFLGFWGIVGLIIYVIYLSYFVLVRLGRQGRSATDH